MTELHDPPAHDEPRHARFLLENQSREELLRRVKALHAEAREMEQILAEALIFPRGDGRFVPRDQYDIGTAHTPVTLAQMAAEEIRRMRGCR